MVLVVFTVVLVSFLVLADRLQRPGIGTALGRNDER